MMRAELDKRLNDLFPSLFRGRGCDCMDGWYAVIERMAKGIAQHAESAGLDVEITDVKSKRGGGLSVLVEGADDEVLRLVGEAEEAAEHTCEVCGAPGQYRPTDGGRVRCGEHA